MHVNNVLFEVKVELRSVRAVRALEFGLFPALESFVTFEVKLMPIRLAAVRALMDCGDLAPAPRKNSGEVTL